MQFHETYVYGSKVIIILNIHSTLTLCNNSTQNSNCPHYVANLSTVGHDIRYLACD